MKPYRTEQEALAMLQGKPEHKPYRELLGMIPSDEVRGLIEARLDKRYKQFKFRNEIDMLRLFDWVETPEGGEYWAKVVGWMIGANDLPELAKGEESVK